MKTLFRLLSLLPGILIFPSRAAAENSAAASVNATGLALHRQMPATGNALLSPWSIQSAMAMTYAGAEGQTRKELAKALNFDDGTPAALQKLSAGLAEGLPKGGTLRTANRLFPAAATRLHPAFTRLIAESYGGEPELLDYAEPARAAAHINDWVEKQTNDHIKNLIPATALDPGTSVVLVNAVYFNVPWEERFTRELTTQQPFWTAPGLQKTVPLMFKQHRMRYAQKKGFQIAALPYGGGRLQFTVIVPDKIDGLAAVEKSLTAALLTECAGLPAAEVRLSLPKFRMEPEGLELKKPLEALGVKAALTPAADFSRMAAGPVFISDVFHKAFIAVDETGTEAAAATATPMVKANGHPHEVPHKVVKADRPFLFAIQELPGGACLFLGRLSDPAPETKALKAAPVPTPKAAN